MAIPPLRSVHRHVTRMRNVAASLPALLLLMATLLVFGVAGAAASPAEDAIAPEVQAAIDALPAGQQSAVLKEISTLERQCRREHLGIFQRCGCVVARYAEARVQDLASRAQDVEHNMLRNLGPECRNRPAIVERQAANCLSSQEFTHPYVAEEVLQEFCSCVGNTVADMFMEAKANVQIGIPVKWGARARVGCGSNKILELSAEAHRQRSQADD